MTNPGLPTKVSLQSFKINGQDVRAHVNTLQVFEDICKPYRTATATIIDNNDIINQLQLVGGEDISFIIMADGGNSYSANLKLFSIKGERLNMSLRSSFYQMQLIGPQYFGDKQNIVQQSFKNIIGTDIISKIHNQFLGGSLNIPVPSTGLLAKNNSIIARGHKPFNFIDDIRRQLMFGQYKTGSSVYYHDNKGVNLAPLEHLFSTLSSQQLFIQTTTAGARWQDIFESVNTIIDATTTIDERSDHHGRMNMKDIIPALQQEKKVIDIFSHKRIFNDLAQTITSGSTVGTPFSKVLKLAAAVGNHGGSHNYYFVDTEKYPKENIRQTDKEALYKAEMTSGPQIMIKVPIQTGFNCTVGKGFTARIPPPMSDRDSKSYDAYNSGDYLCIALEHTAHFDDHSLAGTTTLHGIKGGIN